MAKEVKTTENMQTTPPEGGAKGGEGMWVSSGELRKEFDRLFEAVMQPSSWFPSKTEGGGLRPPWNWGLFSGGFSPAVDFEEKSDEYVITAEIPGVEAKDLSVDVSGEVLTIKGEKTQEHEQKSKNYHIRERSAGSFQRSFPLPRNVDGDKIAASFDNGLLTVVLPKVNGGNMETKKVSISSP